MLGKWVVWEGIAGEVSAVNNIHPICKNFPFSNPSYHNSEIEPRSPRTREEGCIFPFDIAEVNNDPTPPAYPP
jgi:hypothetical protein